MIHYLHLIYDTLKKIWINVFWKKPAHLWACKVTVSIDLLLIPDNILIKNEYLGRRLA